MRYAVIPTIKIPLLLNHYKVINQIFIGEDENSLMLPFMMLEDDFNSEQENEILSNEGIIFNDSSEYFEWLKTKEL